MKSTIDQISLDTKTMQYTLYLSFKGNQNRIGITHADAQAIIDAGECDIENHEGKVYWIPKEKK